MPVDDYFFLSYARKDEENLEHIGQFFDNLRERVRSQLGNADDPEDYIGFIDQEMRPGTKWRLSIAEALATTKTLICVCSQRYFHRPYCGKEVRVFLDRLAKHGGNPPVILPLMWRETPVPPILSQFQDLTNSLPAAYKEHGLRKLIVQQEKYKYDYDDLLEDLAKLIIQAYKVNLEPLEPPPDLDKVKEAFPDAASVTAPMTAVYQPIAGGPNSVRFAYVTSQLPAQWNPYSAGSASPQSIGVVATGTAASKNFFPDVFEFTPNFVNDLNEAKKKNSLVVFLVEAGTVGEPSWRDRLEALDGLNFFNLGTLVLWPEHGRQPGVQQELEKVFDDNYKRNYPVYFRDDIDSSDRFRTSLADLLETLRLSVVNQGPPKREVSPSSFSPSGAL